MSVHFNVYLRQADLPTWDRWQAAIEAEGIDLQLEPVDSARHTGFWPCVFEKNPCGFEFSFGQMEPLDNDADELRVIGDRDYQASFITHSSIDDCRAASFAAAVLAKVCDGAFVDPQSADGVAIGNSALVMVRSQDKTERELKMANAMRKWSAATSRRCPDCGAPYPEYRPTCFVCGCKIGRA